MSTSKIGRFTLATFLAITIHVGVCATTPVAFAGGGVPVSLKQAPPATSTAATAARIDLIGQIRLLLASVFVR